MFGNEYLKEIKMKYSDIHKKGYGEPTPSDIIEGGLGIDVQNKIAYSRAADGSIFPLGINEEYFEDRFEELWKGKFSFDLSTRTLRISE